MTPPPAVTTLLPLPPATFHILVSLGGTERHGYAIIQEVAHRTEGAVRLGAGTLYRSIQRMQEQGLIIESRKRPAPRDDDERRRYYKLTPFGLVVMRAETARLADMVRMARATGLVPRRA